MQLEVGAIVEGKVTGITKFGAFVSLPGGKSGLVHISEIAYSYVSEVSEHLKEGQEVKVKVIGVDDNGRLNLSIKKAEEKPPVREERRAPAPRPDNPPKPAPAPEKSFEDKLKQFMQDSDSKMSGIRQYEKKSSRRRGGNNNYDW